jgi:hypothetical protein
LIVLGGSVFVLLFMDCDGTGTAGVAEAAEFARSIEQHNPPPGNAGIAPVLVCTGARSLIRRRGDVVILSQDRISDYFNVQAEIETEFPIDAGEWLAAKGR